MKTHVIPNSHLILESLDHEQLAQMVEELREEKLMREASSSISEIGTNDAALKCAKEE